ncbi:lamin-like protein [Tanacetum coccineum]|uniref:Lamin-like protein n=1 Tax=Tanacetum coccineum TaxID=301880 RepID=A0ABQ5BRQ4_9ASTR
MMTIISFLLLLIATTSVSATDHIVGANRGWNPGLNYTLWANNHTFYVGDFISFRYQKFQYNVVEVNKTGYDNCTLDSAVGNWSSGKDFILLNKSQRYYFICGTGGCMNGMKVAIRVHPLPSPPASATALSSTSAAVDGVSVDWKTPRGVVIDRTTPEAKIPDSARLNEDLLTKVKKIQEGYQNQDNLILQREREAVLKKRRGVRKFQSLRLGRIKLEDEFFQEEENDAGHVRAPTPLA